MENFLIKKLRWSKKDVACETDITNTPLIINAKNVFLFRLFFIHQIR